MKKLLIIIIFISMAAVIFARGSSEKKINIYYTSSLNGNLDGCDCKGNPRSGLVKRAVYLRSLDKNNSLLLEAGDIFDVYEDKLLSDYILESYLDLGYDAIAVGDQEFSNGKDFLLESNQTDLLRTNNLSILNNSEIFEQISDKPLVISKNGISIAILSIIDPETIRFYPEEIINSIQIEDPESELKKLLSNPEVSDSDLRVLIFHGSVEKARVLSSKIASLNIIIVGHEQQIIDGEKTGNAIIVSPGGEGNLLGHLEVLYQNNKLIFDNNFISFDYMKDPDDKIIRARIDEYTQIMKNRLENYNSQ
ncbi:MAG: hypothetical protein KAQ93_01625 [Spirochaetales bacterium]|nr:hypothetical protein [Spirochaetales bacterium]